MAQTVNRSAQPARETTFDVSVVIPAFNAAESLEACVTSAFDAGGDSARVQVVVVDDGSTDGTPDVIRRLSTRYPDSRFVAQRQANSGWPGSPRNRGMDLSEARYLFFLDADDALAAGALGEMVEFADGHHSDVVVPQMVSARRRLHEDVFERTLIDAPLALLARNNFVFKLMRTEVVVRSGARFSELPVRLEDAQFVFAVYATAQRVSILANRDLYFLDAFDHDGHISSGRAVPRDVADAVLKCLRSLIKRPARSDDREKAVGDFFRRTMLVRYGPAFEGRPRAEKIAWVRDSHRVALDGIDVELARRQYGRLNLARYWALVKDDAVGATQVAKRGSQDPFGFARVVACTEFGRIRVELTPALGSTSLSDVRVTVGGGGDAKFVPGVRSHAEERVDHIMRTRISSVSVPLYGWAIAGAAGGHVFVVAKDQRGRKVRMRLGADGGAPFPTARWFPLKLTSYRGVDVKSRTPPAAERAIASVGSRVSAAGRTVRSIVRGMRG